MRPLGHGFFSYAGYFGTPAVCELEIHMPTIEGELPVIIATEIPENKGTSITNLAEYLACCVPPMFHITAPFHWIEHYPERGHPLHKFAETFSFVRFESYDPIVDGADRVKLGSPKWIYTTRDEIERLIGGPLCSDEGSQR